MDSSFFQEIRFLVSDLFLTFERLFCYESFFSKYGQFVAMNLPMVRQSTEFFYPFIDYCIDFARDFSADCFIYTQSIACKQFGSVPQLLREALKEELGIPMLLIEFDAGDARMTSLKSFKEKISMFIETIS